ncbi:IS3 family transposase [Streptomyces sp. QH1-20]|uniref:IS3 family transposase n=1 Tax=Streptomyces sp. QH1-20 TaxID=3240934 RepID=UPI003518B215
MALAGSPSPTPSPPRASTAAAHLRSHWRGRLYLATVIDCCTKEVIGYMSAEYREVLRRLALRRSAGRTWICFDSAMAESFFAALKNERVSRVTYLTHEAARQDITRYIEFWCNHKHLHSAMDYRPPC